MKKTNRWILLATLLALTTIDADAPRLFAAEPTPTRAVWKPTSDNPFESDRRFVETLLERGFADLANDELDRLESRFDELDEPARLQFAATAIRVVVESSPLTTVEERADVDRKIAEIRNRIETLSQTQTVADQKLNASQSNVEFFSKSNGADAPTLEYATALVRAYFELGVLEIESATVGDAPPETPVKPGASSAFLTAAREISQAVAQNVAPADAAFPFVYLNAKIILAQEFTNRLQPQGPSTPPIALSFNAVDAAVQTLENSSTATRPDLYFFAKLLGIESARIRGDVDAASRLIAETLRELDAAPNAGAPDFPREIAAALVAEETRLLTLEGKTNDALRLASADVDLLNRPLPKNSRRFNALFFDVFADRDLERVAIFWRAASDAETQPDEKQRLIDSAKFVASRLPSNFWQTRASFLVRDASRETADWRTTEAAAEENFRRERWEAALADYDRASEEALASGADVDAFRLAAASAGIVDKIFQDKIYEQMRLASNAPEYWRADAARRFEKLSRSRPDDPIASRFFLLALEYSRPLDASADELDDESASKRFDYLTLFPTADNRDKFAIDSARLALAVGRLNDAATFLDFVDAASPDFEKSLDLWRLLWRVQLADADSADAPDVFADALDRLLSKTTAGKARSQSSTQHLIVERLNEIEKNLSRETLGPNDSKIFALLFELALSTEFLREKELNDAFEKTLDAWAAAVALQDGPDSSEILASIGAFRLSLWLDAQKTDRILQYAADVGNASPRDAGATLRRLLDFAERAPLETQQTLGKFVLSALEVRQTGQDASNIELDNALLRADALRFAGKTQESLTLFAQIRKKNPKNVDAIRGIAKILTARSEPSALEQALRFWSDVADVVPIESPDWWDAKERCVEIYVRLGRQDQAAKTTKILWLTRSDPTDPDRRARWERLVKEKPSSATPSNRK